MKNLVLALILPTVARKAQAAALQVIRALVLCLLLIPLSDQIARGQSFLGNAVSLNGTNQYVTIPNFGNIIPTNEVTVEFWVYTTKAIGQSAFILNPDATTNRFNGHINYGTPPVDGSTYWDFGNINSSGRLSVAAPVNSLSNWVHYALVSSQSTIPPSLSVYTNGVLQTNKFGASTFVRGSYSLLIGGGSGFPFNGRIDEFRVWNVARSAAQIQASYTAPLVGNEANLVVYYKFDNASGTVATNSATATGATYDGTVTNNPAWVGSVPATSVPTVMTLAATGVSNTVAQLNGTVNPNFYATTAWLEWGLYAANNTNSTALVSVGNGSSSVSVTNVLSGLTPGVTYHVRIAASNIWGVARGKDVSFVSPAVALNGAASVTNECHAAFTDSGATVAVRPLALAGGGNHNVALKSDGTVVAWGNSADGRTNTAGLSNVVDVAAGFEHSLALKRDGTVVAWGKNAYLQTNVPAGLSNVVAIAAGNTHSLALKSNGTVTGWGDNDNSTTIIPPASVANAVAVAAGEWFSVALKSSGTVVAWGYNDSNNQTNVPTGLTNVVAISSGRTHSIALKSDGTVIGWGNTANGRTNTAGLSNVVAIAAGGSHNLVLKRDGTVIAWGDNSQGQTNVPTSLSNVVAIAAGDLHSLALKSDGTIVGWGLLSFGITNPPGNLPTFSSVVTVSGTFNTNNAPGTYALNYTATNVLGGSNTVSRTIVVQDTVKPVLTMLGNSPITNSLNVAFVDPGATALDACAGSVSVSTNSTVNVSVPGSYTVTYTATDSFSNTTNVVRTVVVAGSPIVTTLPATGVSNSVATLHGTVIPNGLTTAVWFEWGLSASSTTNITSTWYAGNVSFSVPINDTVSGFTAGLTYYYRTVATNSLGVVRGNAVAFGSPVIALNGGTLSSECHTAFTDPATAKGAPRAIAAGDSHSLAIKSDGTVIAWGAGKTDTGSPPEHGQSIIPANVSNVLALASGIYHNLALKSDMTVVAWGRNFDGETNIPVGLTNAVGVAAGYSHSLVLRSTGTVAVWGNNAYGQTNVPAGLTSVSAIAAGGSHSLALKSNTTVVAWGRSSEGQTNVPAGLTNVIAVAGGAFHSLALKSDGTVVAWGNNGVGQTNVPVDLSNVVAIAGGYYHSLALKSDGTVVAWGAGTIDNGFPYQAGQSIIPAGLSDVVAIAAGTYHSLALKSDGTIVGWGYNGWGQTTIPADVNTFAVSVSSSLNTNAPGSYVLTYTATNSLGGIATPASRTVVVQDTTAPLISPLGNNPLTNFLNASLSDPGATAFDACGGSVSVSSSNNVNVNVVGSYTITYTSTDNYSNKTSVVRTVLVMGPPTFSGFTAAVVGTNAANGSRTVQFTAGANPNGLDSSINFQYGLTSSYAGTNGPVSVAGSFAAGNVTVTVPGFSSGVTYHWNVTGINIAGSSSSPDQTFTIGTPAGSGILGDFNGDGFVSQSELDAVYGNYVTNSPWLSMTNVAGLGGTNVTFELSSSPTNSAVGAYSIQYSTNLSNWLPLGSATPRYLFTDTNAPASPQRHYRLVYP